MECQPAMVLGLMVSMEARRLGNGLVDHDHSLKRNGREGMKSRDAIN